MKNKETLQEALQREDGIEAFIAQKSRSDKFQEKKRIVEAGSHPTDKMLEDYVWDRVDEASSQIIRKHNMYCGICAKKVLQLRGIKHEAEEKLLDWADGNREIPQPSPDEFMTPLEPKIDIYAGLASDYHVFQGAGQQVSAAGMPEQEYRFVIEEEGDISIHCYWGEARGTEPAYIWLSWDANIESEKVFYARFVNPENDKPRCDIRLGTNLVGERPFTSDELGFNPTRERWAIAIVLREVEE